jgi:hypothetical protein
LDGSPKPYHAAGLRRGTATSKIHEDGEYALQFERGCVMT